MADRKASKRPSRTTPPAPAERGRVASFSLTAGWACAVLALLTVLFFHPVVFEGKTFVSPDATAPAGFVRVGEKSLYQDHVYPLWNPYVFLGMPSFASGTYNPLIYPPDWPVAVLQKILPLPELTWMLIYFILGGWFMYLLAREWGARSEGALLGAVAFVFAPNLIAVGSHGHGSQLVNSAYVPLMLWLATRWMRRGSLADLGWLALAGGFQMLRGHVQICFYTWLAIGVYAVVEWIMGVRERERALPLTLRAGGIAIAAALAFGIAGFYNLPLSDYAHYSIRGTAAGGGVGMEYATQWSLSPAELPEIVVPGWAGFGGATYWGSMPFTDYPNAYVGMITIALALPAFLANGVPRVFALVIALLALTISFGKNFPLYGFLYDHLPLFNKFRIPVMVILLFQVASSLGLAWGWSAILDRGRLDPSKRALADRMLIVCAVALGAALIIGVAGRDAFRSSYVSMATAAKGGGGAFSPDAAMAAFQGFVSDLARVALIGLLAIGAAWLVGRNRVSAPVGSVMVLVLLLIELWPVSARVMQPAVGEPAARNLELGRDDVVDFLEKAGPAGTFRVLPSVDEFQSNRYAGFAIASLGGYHAAKPRIIQDFIEAKLPFDVSWMRLLNIRYVIVPQRLESTPPFLREVHSGSAVVYENLSALPRATVVGAYRVVTPAKGILDSVRSGTVDPAEVTLLDHDPHLALGPVTGARATIVSYRLNDVTVDVDTPGPGLLRLADLYYPDWTATVDGRTAPVLRADYLLRAVPVPAGRHRVVFEFQSPSLARGLTISLVSLAAALLMLGVGLLMPRWKRAPRIAETGAGEAV
jgi:hypothetical protein